MSHVDEGTIHAWLDGAFAPDDPERSRIEAHLAECEACGARVEAERRMRERAGDVLGAASPDAVRVEPFESILAARRARDAAAAGQPMAGATSAGPAADGETDAAGSPAKTIGGFRIPMALAATLVLALGATWFVRQYLPGPGAPASFQVELMDDAAEQESVTGQSQAAPPPAMPAPAEAAGAGARAEAGRDLAEADPAAPPAVRDLPVPATPSTGVLAPVVVSGAQIGTTAVTGRSAATLRASAEQRARTPEETRRIAESALRLDSALRLEGMVVTGFAVSAASQIADAGAVIAVNRLDATGDAVWAPSDPDTVAAQFGMAPVELAGETPDSVHIGSVGGAAVARFVYVLDGESIELLQWVTGSVGAEAERLARERQAAADEARNVAAEAKAVSPVSPSAWRLGRIDFILRGAVPADSLMALAARIRAGS